MLRKVNYVPSAIIFLIFTSVWIWSYVVSIYHSERFSYGWLHTFGASHVMCRKDRPDIEQPTSDRLLCVLYTKLDSITDTGLYSLFFLITMDMVFPCSSWNYKTPVYIGSMISTVFHLFVRTKTIWTPQARLRICPHNEYQTATGHDLSLLCDQSCNRLICRSPGCQCSQIEGWKAW